MKLSDVLRIANDEIGYIAKKNRTDELYTKAAPNGKGLYTKYAQELYNAGYFNGNKNGYNYCAVFVNWVLYRAAGSLAEARKYYAYTIYGASSTYSARAFQQDDCFSDSLPSVGSFIFFYDKSGDIAHTGFVTDYNPLTGKITTVEGNVNNTVVTKTYDDSDECIAGFGYVTYEAESDEDMWATVYEDETHRLQVKK